MMSITGFLLYIIVATRVQAQNGAMVYGTVVDDADRPVAGARVTVWRKPASDTLGIGKDPGSTATRSNGAFYFPGLAPGSYRFCAHLPKSDLISPCRWTVKAPMVSVRTNAMILGLKIRLEKGHRIPIEIEDSGGRISAHVGKTKGAVIDVGVSGPGEPYLVAEEMGKKGNNHEYSVVVPYDIPVRVSVHSDFFTLGDKDGRPLTRGQIVSSQVAARGKASEPVRVRVLGSKGN